MNDLQRLDVDLQWEHEKLRREVCDCQDLAELRGRLLFFHKLLLLERQTNQALGERLQVEEFRHRESRERFRAAMAEVSQMMADMQAQLGAVVISHLTQEVQALGGEVEALIHGGKVND